MIRRSLLVLLISGLQSLFALVYCQSELDVFRLLTGRMNATSLASMTPTAPVYSLLSTLRSTGKWADLNYADRSASRWEAAFHWDRILQLTQAYRSPGNPLFNQPDLKAKIVQAIAWWNQEKPVCSNYWWNTIGVPLKMGESFLLLGNDLPDKDRNAGIALMKLGVKPDYYDYHGRATGQNQIWLATVHLMTSLMEHNSNSLQRAFSAIYNEIRLTTDEGIQPDYSFHQHGAILYSGGYGLSFTRNVGQLIRLVQGTPYQFPADKKAVFDTYVLDGQQWMIRGHTFDHSAVGREIARPLPKNASVGTGLVGLGNMLATLTGPRQAEFQQLANQLAGKTKTQLTGNRHFWRSDLMSHHRAGYYSSVKMTSERLLSNESGNGENMKGYYLGHGVQLIYRTGDEYRNIFPVWDWRRVPGTLCEQSAEPLPLFNWGKDTKGATSFVGGVSDGTYGLAASDYRSGNVKARKAWFYFDQEIVCLGTGISCSSQNTLYQSINQCYLKGEVLVSSDGNQPKIRANGQHALTRTAWVWHDSVGYFFPEKGDVTVKNDSQTGSWRSINNSPVYSADTLQLPVFSLWINLGGQVHDQSYYYVIRPSVSAKSMGTYRNPVVVLRNDSTLQAVQDTSLQHIQAAFYQAGTLNMGNGMTLTVDQPILLMTRNRQTELEITLADPQHKLSQVEVEMNQHLSCESCRWIPDRWITIVSARLPTGVKAGQSIRISCKKF
jgi:chondroitin AC lyase